MQNRLPIYLRFREIQRLTQWWIWLLVAAVEALVIYIFVQQIILGQPVGNNPAHDGGVWVIFIFAGICFPLLMYSVKLITEIFPDRLVVRLFPLWRRTIYLRDVSNVTAREYRPLGEYGGWGIRYSFSSGWCYTLGGNRGVQLELRTGKPVLIGSQESEKLATIINQVCADRA